MSVLIALVASAAFGVMAQDDAHPPRPWRVLTASEQTAFDLGHAVFNTQWTPAGEPAGRRDGLGPLFNAPSCDACHNSRRRGRGPAAAGPAPVDLVIQVGMRQPDGGVSRGTERFGYILNTSALDGMEPEASVSIRYKEVTRAYADGTRISLRSPTYVVTLPGGGALPAGLVMKPRMPQSAQGVGLLERVSSLEILKLASAEGGVPLNVRGRASMIGMGDVSELGRFGWQATEPTVASQVAAAFSREMGLTTPAIDHIDCGQAVAVCASKPNGGTPEVDLDLYRAVVLFEQMHAVPSTVTPEPTLAAAASKRFADIGCGACHRSTLHATSDIGDNLAHEIHPYTDLLLHYMGEDLSDRDAAGEVVLSEFRTAPLWGINASVASVRALRLMHDGRARSIEEAIAWHGGAGATSRAAFEKLSKEDRDTLLAWIATL
ncbi:MAG: di-heme oxidoredictase family protein [Gammaproteobacteria bacterium]